jgi:Xaa-Pro aminopeptidase
MPSRLRCLALFHVLLVLAVPAGLPAQDTAFAKQEFAARRARLMELVPDGVALVFGGEEHGYNVRFRQSPDFFYLTGIEQSGTVLLVNGVTKRAVVFAPGQSGAGESQADSTAGDRYGIDILPIGRFFGGLDRAVNRPGVRKLYLPVTPPDDQLHARSEARILAAMALDNPVFGHAPPLAGVVERIRDAEPQLPVDDVNPLLDSLRWVKTPYEIARLRRAGAIGAAAVAGAIRGTRPGMYEYEVAAAAQYVNTRLGARGDAFPPIVPSGPNAPDVHYEANSRRMQAGDLVYLDYGSDYDYYESDITRVWPVSGRFTAEQERMYRCVLEARNAIIAAMRPGVTIRQMQDAAEPVYERYGWKDAYLRTGRYVGHFVGISVHDVGDGFGPGTSVPFRAGVVFNVEPVLEFPERGIHLRLEDTILITADGAENLTAAVPVAVDSIYRLIRERGVNSGGASLRPAGDAPSPVDPRR